VGVERGPVSEAFHLHDRPAHHPILAREALAMTAALVNGDDGKRRCVWGASSPEYVAYHDTEWGRPVRGDVAVLERICLEGFQSGLSWITILRKRENFRSAFAGFEPDAVAKFGARDLRRLLADAGIVRHRGKIEATIANARAVVSMHERGESLSDVLWSFQPTRRRAAPKTLADVPAKTDASVALSKQLQQLGFRFVGPTTMYAAMQAMGIVNDHIAGCHAR
jgi:DNA-3-methyladenine glycosylase I